MGLTVAILGKFNPTCGQVSTLNTWLAVGLAEKGVNVVVCTDAQYPRKEAVRVTSGVTDRQINSELFDGVTVVYAEHLEESVFLPFSELGYVSYLAHARKTIQECRPDVILSHYLEPYALAGCQIAAEFRIPHVVTHAGSDIVRLCGSDMLRSLFRSLLTNVTYFVPKSKIAREMFGDVCATRNVAPYWPDPRYFNSTSRSTSIVRPGLNEPIFGFYGKFVHGKKLDEVISAFRIYRERFGRGRLILIGGEIGGKFHLDDYVRKEDHGSIEVHDFIPNWEIPGFINQLTCLIYTKSGYKVAQHASIILREAIACGASVIATEESFAGSPVSLSKLGRVTRVDSDIDPEALSHVMAEVVETACQDAEPIRGYFERGYQEYVESWYQCLKDAAAQGGGCGANRQLKSAREHVQMAGGQGTSDIAVANES